MRRTGNISSLPAIAMKVEPTVNGVLTLLPARPGVAQPATAPTVIAAADWITARRLFCGMASSWSVSWRAGSLAPRWARPTGYDPPPIDQPGRGAGNMILEVADIRIAPGKQAEFDEAILRGIKTVVSKSKGFLGYKVNKGIETPERYILLIVWETLENHTIDFRQSPAFTA